jgi:hypothetical protein
LPDPELERLEASASTLVRRAYELGWSDALRRVVEEINARSPGAERLDLAPAVAEEPPPPPEAVTPPEPEPAPEPEFKPLKKPAKPWWARLGRQQ